MPSRNGCVIERDYHKENCFLVRQIWNSLDVLDFIFHFFTHWNVLYATELLIKKSIKTINTLAQWIFHDRYVQVIFVKIFSTYGFQLRYGILINSTLFRTENHLVRLIIQSTKYYL